MGGAGVSVALGPERASIPGKEAAAAGICGEQLYEPPGSSKQRRPVMTTGTTANILGSLLTGEDNVDTASAKQEWIVPLLQ